MFALPSSLGSPRLNTVVGAAGSDQRTDDLAVVLQEIVDRSDWSAGNALALILSGDGRRVAESYDGTAAPELVIQYTP